MTTIRSSPDYRVVFVVSVPMNRRTLWPYVHSWLNVMPRPLHPAWVFLNRSFLLEIFIMSSRMYFYLYLLTKRSRRMNSNWLGQMSRDVVTATPLLIQSSIYYPSMNDVASLGSGKIKSLHRIFLLIHISISIRYEDHKTRRHDHK